MKRNVKQFYNFMRTFSDVEQFSDNSHNYDLSKHEFTASSDAMSESYDEYLSPYDNNSGKTIILPILHYEDFYYQTVSNETSFTVDCWSSMFREILSSI
jgi:hypothetical protein